MPSATRSRSVSMADHQGCGPDDEAMLLSQARSGEAAHACDEDAPPPGPPPRPVAAAAAPPASTSARSSVRFAPGPLLGTQDGHPLPTEARPKGGPPRGARSLARGTPWWEANAAWAEEPLTPAHLRLLAAELGPENAPSITRLKRR
jgi:hypothetical protein